MYYFLNGGGHEFRSLAASDLNGWLKTIGVKNLLIVTFALVESHWQKLWEHPKLIPFVNLGDIEITSLTTTTYSTAHAQKLISDADAIWFPGGSPDVLLKRSNELGFTELLKDAQAAGSVLAIGGASAGEMALGEQTIVGRTDVKLVMQALGVIPGHLFDSHFNERRRDERLKAVIDTVPQLTGVGIDEDTTLILNDNFAPVAVFGPGKVTYYQNKQGFSTYDHNSTF